MDENNGIVGFLFRLERLSGEDDFVANMYRITDSWYNRKTQQRGMLEYALSLACDLAP
jgi:hypothetical protein